MVQTAATCLSGDRIFIGLEARLQPNRARQLYKNISMLFLFPVTRDLLFTII